MEPGGFCLTPLCALGRASPEGLVPWGRVLSSPPVISFPLPAPVPGPADLPPSQEGLLCSSAIFLWWED